MKKIKNIVLLFVAVISLASCSVSGPATNYKALVTKNPIGSKVGIAETKVWFGLFPMHVDVSIAAAAKKGKITKVATVDYEQISGLFSTTYRTIVTGTNDEPEPEKKEKKKRRRSRRK